MKSMDEIAAKDEKSTPIKIREKVRISCRKNVKCERKGEGKKVRSGL